MGMTAEVDECGFWHLQIVRGDRFAIVYEIDRATGDDQEVFADALWGAEWLAQVKARASDTQPLLSLTPLESTVGTVTRWVFACLDSTPLLPDKLYRFDCQPTTGPLAPLTVLEGDLFVRSDVSREVA